jgi:hypothetical protein
LNNPSILKRGKKENKSLVERGWGVRGFIVSIKLMIYLLSIA